MITRHKWRDSDATYYKVGSMEVSQYDAMEFWILMCGEEAIKDFLKKCEREREGSRQVVPELKKEVQK